MPRGANKEREQEYEEMVDEFQDEGRYKGREEEVAARIVNKQRAEYGETKAEKAEDRHGKSPDRGLPLPNFEHLTVDEITRKLASLSREDVEQIRDYEKAHKDRKTLLEALNRALEKKH